MITLTISYDPATGQLGLKGPVGDKVACLGVMEMAKHALLSGRPSESKPALVVAGPVIPDLSQKRG